MIVVDTSALMAILLDEPSAGHSRLALEQNPDACISGGTFAEALIVANRRGLGEAMVALVDELSILVEPVTAAAAARVADAYGRWGRGVHPAGLNFGDCFAYALATEKDCALVYVGDDFARTDVRAFEG